MENKDKLRNVTGSNGHEMSGSGAGSSDIRSSGTGSSVVGGSGVRSPGMRGPGMGGPGMRGGGEKAKDFTGTWKKLIGYIRSYIAVIIIAVICAISGTILNLIGPDKLKELTNIITNGFLTGIDMDGVAKIGFTLVALYASGAVLSIVQHLIMAVVTQKVTKKLRSDIDLKINRLPMWFYNRTSTGDVLSRVTNDVDTIGQSLNMSIGTLVSAITLFIGSLIMMLKNNVIMTLTAIGATLIGFILMLAIMGRSQKYFNRQQKHLGEINGHVEEIYAGHTVVKAYNGEAEAKKTFDRMNENLRNSAFRAQCLSGLMMPIMTFIGNFGYVAVCIVGAALALNGKIEFGVIVAFMMYVRYFTQPLSQMAQAMQSMQSPRRQANVCLNSSKRKKWRTNHKNHQPSKKQRGLLNLSM